MMHRAKGFTVIEIIAIMMVVSIIAVFAVINYPSNAAFNQSALTEQLKRDIHYTQTLAMSLNTNYTISTSANNYFISPTPPEGAVSVNMPSGVTLSVSSITFDYMGNPLNASPVNITITATGVGSNTLTVVPETGFVHG